MEEKFLKIIKSLAQEGGKLAMANIEDSTPSLKKDNSVLTQTDMAISNLSRQYLADYLKGPDHLLIEEEDPDIAKYLDKELLDKTTYCWAIDPIDGTRNYANQMPHFAVSIGLMKNKRPWIGAVYFPFLSELFYCDGHDSYYVQKAFSKTERVRPIKPIDQTISSQSVFFAIDIFFREFNWDFKDCHVQMMSCAAVDLCWPSIARGCGAIFRSSLWDFAGSWPIAISAGLDLRSLETGVVLDQVDLDLFHHTGKPWKLKDFHILSSKRNYPLLKEKIKPRGPAD